VVECRRWLQAFDQRNGPAQESRIENWLLKLLAGVIGDRSRDEVQMRVAALVFAVADRPAFCFDDRSLRRAMARFKFWPSAAELIAFAEQIETEGRETAQRAWRVVDIGPRALFRSTWAEAPDRPKRDPKELEAVSAICARIRANLADGPQPATPKAADAQAPEAL
jgi:hypothetical protein